MFLFVYIHESEITCCRVVTDKRIVQALICLSSTAKLSHGKVIFCLLPYPRPSFCLQLIPFATPPTSVSINLCLIASVIESIPPRLKKGRRITFPWESFFFLSCIIPSNHRHRVGRFQLSPVRLSTFDHPIPFLSLSLSVVLC